jgi:arylsulfatase A-like enzyme
LALASIFAAFFHFHPQWALRFQKQSLVFLIAAAACCVVIFPFQQHWKETRELAQLPRWTPGARNVLVIVVDTLRADHLSTYGYSRPTSPNLTRIANQGVLFENAISTSSWTLPVHASMLTGLYPHDHRAIQDRSSLGSGYRTLGEALETRGYRTAAFSANTIFFSRGRGLGRGFIHFEDDFQTLASTFQRSFYGGRISNHLCQLRLVADWPGRKTAEEINQHALHWIDSDRRPFFVFLNYYDVHDPYRPPDPYLHYYGKPRNFKQSEWFRSKDSFCNTNKMDDFTPEERAAALDTYDGAINYVDEKIAELIEELKKRGLVENTLVIITSDHGEGFYEHGTMNHATSLYRELIHVPLIFSGTGQIPAGKKVTEPVSLTALPATVLDLLGDRDQREFSEPSLTQLWSDRGPPGKFAAPISELAQLRWNPRSPEYYGPMQSLTTSQWHYIAGGNSGEELYRCCDNQPENLNLASTVEGKQVCQQFRQELQMTLKSGEVRRQDPAEQLFLLQSH